MLWKLDLRSLLAGVVLSFLAVALLGAAPNSDTAQPSGIGRFQITAGAGASSAEAFLVDTVTGEVWQQRNQVRNSPEFFEPKINADQK